MDKFAFHLETLFMPAKKRKSYTFIFWAIIILGGNLFYSCQDEDCLSVYNNYLVVEFFKADTLVSGKIDYHPVDTFFYSITATGNDLIFYNQDSVFSRFKLPVDPASNFSTFILKTIDSIAYDTLSHDPLEIEKIYYPNPIPETITVSYKRSQSIITEECGVEIAYTNVYLEEISFPSFNLKNDNLSRLNEQLKDEVNVEVFF